MAKHYSKFRNMHNRIPFDEVDALHNIRTEKLRLQMRRLDERNQIKERAKHRGVTLAKMSWDK